jgi:hypothetical protein
MSEKKPSSSSEHGTTKRAWAGIAFDVNLIRVRIRQQLNYKDIFSRKQSFQNMEPHSTFPD